MMRRVHKFTVMLDADDVLLSCIGQAVEWANRDYNFNPPLAIDEVTQWDPSGKRTDVIFRYFKREDFFEAQQPLEGAKEFVRKLSKIAEVFLVTAIPAEFTGIRFKQLKRFFKEIPEKNFIPAYRKDVVQADFLLDDGAHNILASNATYPVLLRRPWNQHMTGILAVNNYDEFLNLFTVICNSYSPKQPSFRSPTILALVAPSASGKTAIAEELIKNPGIEKPKSTTTRDPRLGEDPNSYHFVSDEEFERLKKNNELAEFSTYANAQYGSEITSINEILDHGRHCVIPIDISGAMALKMQYRTVLIYIKRNKEDIYKSMIQRINDGMMAEKDFLNRMLAIDAEKKNEQLCDYVVDNDDTIESAADSILEVLRLKQKEE